MKIGRRFTLFFTLISGCILFLFAGLYYLQTAAVLSDSINKSLDFITSTTKEMIDTQNEFPLPSSGAQMDEMMRETLNDYWLEIYSENNQRIFISQRAKLFPIDLDSRDLNKPFFDTVAQPSVKTFRYYETEPNSLIHLRVKVKYVILENGKKYLIISAMPTDLMRKDLRRLFEFTLIGIGVFILIFIFVGQMFTRYVLRPLIETTAHINRIGGEKLSERIIIANKNDELGQLQTALNGLFERLENTFLIQRQFISNISHELRTPLSILRLSLESLENRLKPGGRKHLTDAQETARRMESLIRVLLLLSQLDERRRVLNKVDCDLKEFFKEIGACFTPTLNLKKIKFSVICEKQVILHCDKDLLSIAFSNLLDNAVKYTEHGSISINVSEKDDKIECLISDTGIGIPDSELDRVYERFYRVDQSRHGDKGYGIGLSLAKIIIELHGGTISIKSVLGKGTNVLVSFFRLFR